MPPYTEPENDPLKQATYLPSPDDARTIDLIETRFKEAESERRGRDEAWLQCVAFTIGKQWHRYNWTSGALELPKAPSWLQRSTTNLMRPKIRQAAAALCADLPQLDVEPMSAQEQDREAARTGKKFLAYIQEELGLETTWIKAARWEAMCGTVFVKCHWDPKALDQHAVPLTDPMTGEIMEEPTGQMDERTGEPIMRTVYEGVQGELGQVRADLVSPFEIYPQPGAILWQDAEWVIHGKVRSLEYIRAYYPEQGRFVKADATGEHAGFLEKRVQDLLDTKGASTNRDENSAVVMECWEKPCRKYPDGRLITVSSGVLLRSGPLPHRYLIENRMLPFVRFGYEDYELSVWAMGLGEDLVPLQREYNSIKSDIRACLKLMGMPKVLWPTGFGPSPSVFTSQAGQIIPFQSTPGMPGDKPQFWSPPPLDRAHFEQLDRIKSEMEDITDRHQVSAGSAPAGITAGVSIQLLQESDNRSQGPIVAGFHAAIAEVGKHLMALASENYDEARLGYVTGEEDNQRSLVAFQAADLPNAANVRAVAASKTPMSRAAKQQQLFDLYDRGVFGPPGSPEANRTLLKRLEFGDVDEMYEEQVAVQVEQQRQQMEMQQMQNMQQLEGQMGLEAQKGEQAMQREGQRSEAQLAAAEMRQQMPMTPGAPPASMGLEGLAI